MFDEELSRCGSTTSLETHHYSVQWCVTASSIWKTMATSNRASAPSSGGRHHADEGASSSVTTRLLPHPQSTEMVLGRNFGYLTPPEVLASTPLPGEANVGSEHFAKVVLPEENTAPWSSLNLGLMVHWSQGYINSANHKHMYREATRHLSLAD